MTKEKEKPWSKKRLDKMLFEGFLGTIADNIIEIGWILCFSLLADKALVERITSMFGLNDSLWVILSATYYAVAISISARLPKLILEKGEAVESKYMKNIVYTYYIMLLPMAIFTLIYLEKILMILNVPISDMELYMPYFQLSVIAIITAAPMSVIIPRYLRAKGRSMEATILDHLVAWGMIIGIFVTTHILKLGVLWALVVNILTNAIPFYWFLIKRPIKGFWSKGFEFSPKYIKENLESAVWEILRRLSPKISGIISAGMMMFVNPVYLAVKYWQSNIEMFINGWGASASLLQMAHISRNLGLRDKNPEKDNNYIFLKSSLGVIFTTAVVYIICKFGLVFLSPNIYIEITNPLIFVIMAVSTILKMRFYTLLAIARTSRKPLNTPIQGMYSIFTIILTPLLIWQILIVHNFGVLGIFIVGLIVQLVQTVSAEIYTKINLKKVPINYEEDEYENNEKEDNTEVQINIEVDINAESQKKKRKYRLKR